MFKLNKDESDILRSQIATSSWGGVRYLPYAFTEQGVAMLSSVLRSKQAIQARQTLSFGQANIQIMRTFTKLREIIFNHFVRKLFFDGIYKMDRISLIV